MKTFLFTTLLITLGVYSLMVGWLYFNQRSLLYFPDTSSPFPIAAGLEDMDVVHYQTKDGLRLFGWYRAAEVGKPTIVYFHGNAGNLLNHSVYARPLIEAGYGVLLVEYRGYGGNPGKPTEEGLYKDARAGIEFLKNAGINESNMVLFGQSLGTGVAVKMASEYAARALILQSPYTSIAKAGQYHYWYMPVRLLIKDQFPSDEMIGGVSAPLLVMYGDKDKTVPAKMSADLYSLANNPKSMKIFEGASHNNLFDAGTAKAVLGFLEGL